jgi:hypothetical protein
LLPYLIFDEVRNKDDRLTRTGSHTSMNQRGKKIEEKTPARRLLSAAFGHLVDVIMTKNETHLSVTWQLKTTSMTDRRPAAAGKDREKRGKHFVACYKRRR